MSQFNLNVCRVNSKKCSTMIVILIVLFVVISSSNAVLLDCNYYYPNWVVLGEQYSCQARLVRFGDDRQVVGVSKNHLAGKNDDDVRGIVINNQEMNFLPKGIELFFKNIRAIHTPYSKLKAITSDDLKGFPELEVASFPVNQVQFLDGDLFIHNPKLQYFDFDNNQITNIGPDFFKPLKFLQFAKLENNLCINSMSENNVTEIQKISRDISFKCPPTVEMSQRIILNGFEFKLAVKSEVANGIVPVDEKLDRIQKQIEELEKLIREIQP
jgi:hypothetical protein